MVAIVLVLCAVFVPVSFLGGFAGELYRQFAVTIAVSVVISGIVALTLTPALCALLLGAAHARPWCRSACSTAPSTGYPQRFTGGYGLLLRHAVLALSSSRRCSARPGGCSSACRADSCRGGSGLRLPGDAAAAGGFPRPHARRTAQVTEGALENPAVENVVTLAGFDSCPARRRPMRRSFVSLTDWSERTDPRSDRAQSARPPSPRSTPASATAIVIGFNPPPIQGMSTTGGFELYLQDRSGGSLESLAEATQRVIAAASQRPELQGVSTTFNTRRAAVPGRGRPREGQGARRADHDVFDTMQSTFGSLYVNDFTLFGRTYRVPCRPSPSSGSPRTTCNTCSCAPATRHGAARRAGLGRRASSARTWWTGSTSSRPRRSRATRRPASPRAGHCGDGAGRGADPSADYTIGWTVGLSGAASAGTGNQGFLFGLVMVFLILAAQYERWSLPLAVIAAVPFAVFGAILAIRCGGSRTTSTSRSGWSPSSALRPRTRS